MWRTQVRSPAASPLRVCVVPLRVCSASMTASSGGGSMALDRKCPMAPSLSSLMLRATSCRGVRKISGVMWVSSLQQHKTHNCTHRLMDFALIRFLKHPCKQETWTPVWFNFINQTEMHQKWTKLQLLHPRCKTQPKLWSFKRFPEGFGGPTSRIGRGCRGGSRTRVEHDRLDLSSAPGWSWRPKLWRSWSCCCGRWTASPSACRTLNTVCTTTEAASKRSQIWQNIISLVSASQEGHKNQ